MRRVYRPNDRPTDAESQHLIQCLNQTLDLILASVMDK